MPDQAALAATQSSNLSDLQSTAAPAIMPVGGSLTKTSKILIVDDEPNVAIILQRVLSSLPNSDIMAVYNPLDALQLFEQTQVDLVITDYKMPQLNGAILATRLKTIAPQVNIIMLTACDEYELHQQINDRSAIQHILSKPTPPHKLRQLVSAVLDL